MPLMSLCLSFLIYKMGMLKHLPYTFYLELNEAELGRRVDTLEQEIEQLKTLLAITAESTLK